MTEKPGSLDSLQRLYEAMTPQQRRQAFWKIYRELWIYIILLNLFVFGLKFVSRPEGVSQAWWNTLQILGPLPIVWRLWVVGMRLVRLRFVQERRSAKLKEERGPS